MKSYKVEELSALQTRMKNMETNLTIEEEKNDGHSIMVNMKTSTFELMKFKLVEHLEENPKVKTVKQTRTAKASTANVTLADTEFYIDV